MSTFTRMSLTVAVLFSIVALPNIASAVIVHTPTFNADGGTDDPSYMTNLGPASATDLIDDASASFDSQSTLGFPTTPGTFFGDPTALNDGTLGTSVFGPDNVFDDTDNVYTTTFFLDTSVNFLGYSISGITSHSGYSGARVGQHYIVSYSIVGSAGFTPLTEVSFNAGAPSQYQSSRVIVSENITGILATGVDAIQFEILVPTDGLGTTYREFDVFGEAMALPEPGSLALLGTGGLLALRRRRTA